MRALVAMLLCLPAVASAHGMRSAYLEVTELDGRRAALRLTCNAPSSGLQLDAPAGCRAEEPAQPSLLLVDCDGGLEGKRIAVGGLGPIISDVVVRVSFAGGATSSRVLSAAEPAWTLPRASRAAWVLTDYVRLGLVHIFTGLDHLLFLAALALALGRLRTILVAETAFTASHTLSFTASSLGLIHVSSLAAEACIALSLILIAVDASERRRPLSSTRSVAALAFVFGLVHGLGFAGGLAEIGLPDRAIGWALAGFAAGVELGQVLFLVVFVGALALITRAPRLRSAPLALGYAVGTTGAFLFFQRLAALVHRT